MSGDWDQFNQHQQSARERADFMAKSVFLVSGAALTLSLNLFLGKDAPKMADECVKLALKAGWSLLFASVVLMTCVTAAILIRDFAFGERWRKRLKGDKSVDISGSPGCLEVLMWTSGVLGVLSMFTGLGALAWVSIKLIG